MSSTPRNAMGKAIIITCVTMKPTIEAHEKGLPTVRKKQKGRTPKPKKTKKKKAKRSKEVNNAENS